jgi:peptidoglycan/LPS O-acetylase OafA/YrhL
MENTTDTDRQHQNRISAVDGLRGVASIVIVAYHVYAFGFFVLQNKLMFIHKYFAFGVTMFLIISAFSLTSNYHNKLQSSGAILDYYLNRYARITPLFLFMMVVWIFFINIDFQKSFPVNVIIINIFYLFNFIPGMQGGISWGSWTMGTLFVFYLFFPLIMMVNKSFKSAMIVQSFFIVIGYTVYSCFNNQNFPPDYAYGNFFSQLPIFGFGILVYYTLNAFNIKKAGRITISIAGLTGIFLGFYLLSRFFSFDLSILYDDKINNNIGYYYIMGLFMAFLLYSQCLYSISLIDNRISRFYGKISYSLYLLHPFVIYKIKSLYPFFQSIDGISKEFAYFICFIVTLLIVTPLAYLLNKIFEERASFIMKTSLKRVFKMS